MCCVCMQSNTDIVYKLLKAENLYRCDTQKRDKNFNQNFVPLTLIAKKFIYTLVCNLNNS